MPIYRHGGKNFVACGFACAAGFKADRMVKAIYGPYRNFTGGFYLDAEEASMDRSFCPYCGNSVKAVASQFTADERVIIQNAARKIWNDIGYDVLASTAQSLGKKVDAITLPKRVVVEIVCDADRLEEELRHQKYPSLAHRVSTMNVGVYPLVRPAFPDRRYGT